MTRKPIASSSIAAVGYDETSQILEIEFRNGGVYHYFGVPARVHEELLAAPSHGHYLAEQIKGRYRYARV